MKFTITIPRCSRRNAAKDAQAAPAPSSLPSRRYSPSKKETHGREAAIAPSVPFITLAAVNAANIAAVAAANPRRRIARPLALTADVSKLVSSTLPTGVAAFPVAGIMPTAALALTAKFVSPEAVAADVSVATAVAYSTLGVIAATAEAVAADVTVATAASANLATAETAAADVPVPVALVALSSASSVAVDFAATAVVAPVVASVGNEGVSFE
jgi:hypothetical protein